MSHLTRDDMLEAIEAGSAAHRAAPWAAHLQACGACRGEVEELRAVLGEAGAVPLPEPSPLFWDQFSRRVAEDVRAVGEARTRDERARGDGWWRRLLRWQVAIPGAAVTAVLLLLAVVTLVPRLQVTTPPAPGFQAAQTRPAPVDSAAESTGPALSADEESLSVLADLVSDVGDPAILLPATPGSAEQAVLQLSDEERGELGRLLQAEIDRGRPRGEG